MYASKPEMEEAQLFKVAIDENGFLIDPGTAPPCSVLASYGLRVIANRLSPVELLPGRSWLKIIKSVAVNRKLALFSSSGQLCHNIVAIQLDVTRQALLVCLIPKRLCSLQLVDSIAQMIGLTRREAEVLYQLGSGLDPKQIASAHGASINTVRAQVKQILEKAGLPNVRSLLIRVGCLAEFVSVTDFHSEDLDLR